MTLPSTRISRGPRYHSTPLFRRKRGGGAAAADAFGVDVIAGPKGSGKSVLAVHRALAHAEGRVRKPDGSCICGRSDCPGADNWVAYTNMESTWIDHPAAKDYGGGWARPLDISSIVKHDLEKHCVVILDEGYQHMDARRGMQTSSIEINDEISQSRKSGVITAFTSVSLDWIDKRIRGQARAYYNCWCPGRDGKVVYAVMTNVSVGHLPPWVRKKVRPKILRFNTSLARKRYNTYDRVQDREMTKSAGGMKRQIYIRDSDTGEATLQPVGEVILNALFAFVERGENVVDPAAVTEVLDRMGVPTTDAEVSKLASMIGFMQTAEGHILIAAENAVV